MPNALITGASRGLGLAAARALAARGWTLVVDARDRVVLAEAVESLQGLGAAVTALPGDVADPGHRRALVAAVDAAGSLDLLVNNASTLGVVPLPPLADHPVEQLAEAYAINVFAPLDLIQLGLPALRSARGTVIDVSSDAAVEAYPGWGGYGSAKAALDRLTAVLAVEETAISWYAVDPGDMRTELHALAAPDEDPAALTPPDEVVPALLRLLDERPPSGRYTAAGLLAGLPTTLPEAVR